MPADARAEYGSIAPEDGSDALADVAVTRARGRAARVITRALVAGASAGAIACVWSAGGVHALSTRVVLKPRAVRDTTRFTVDTACVPDAIKAAHANFFSSPIVGAKVVHHNWRTPRFFKSSRDSYALTRAHRGEYQFSHELSGRERVDFEYGFVLVNKRGEELYEIGDRNSPAGIIAHTKGEDSSCFTKYGKYYNRVRQLDDEQPMYAFGTCSQNCVARVQRHVPIVSSLATPTSPPAPVLDSSLTEGMCNYKRVSMTQGNVQFMEAYTKTAMDGKAKLPWTTYKPRIFMYVKKNPGTTLFASSNFNIYSPRSGGNRKFYDQQSASPSGMCGYSLNSDDDNWVNKIKGNCEARLLTHNDVMKSNDACEPGDFVGVQDFGGGQNRPSVSNSDGEWVMSSSVYNIDSFDDGYYAFGGSMYKNGPGEWVFGFQYAEDEYGIPYGQTCADTTFDFEKRRSPFMWTIRISTGSSAQSDFVNGVDSNWATSGTRIIFTDHENGLQTVVEGTALNDAIASEQQSKSYWPFQFVTVKQQAGCDSANLPNWMKSHVPTNTAPSGFFSQ